jgi:hypothetical protein
MKTRGFTGKKHTEESKLKISKSHLGNKNPMYGKGDLRKGSKNPMYGRKISEKARKVLLEYSTDRNNVNWKGDKVGYRALHSWISRKRGQPHYCEVCKRDDLRYRQYHWANKSGKYKRELSDWIRLCVKCHKEFDR